MHKKGDMTSAVYAIPSIILIFLTALILLGGVTIINPEPKEVHIVAGYYGEENDILEQSLRFKIEDFEGDFVDLVFDSVESGDFSKVELVLEKVLDSYENYEFVIGRMQGNYIGDKLFEFKKGSVKNQGKTVFVSDIGFRLRLG